MATIDTIKYKRNADNSLFVTADSNSYQAYLIKSFSCEMRVPDIASLVEYTSTPGYTFYWIGLAPENSGDSVIQPVLSINDSSGVAMRALSTSDQMSRNENANHLEQWANLDYSHQAVVNSGDILHPYINYHGRMHGKYVYVTGFSNPELHRTVSVVYTDEPYVAAQICVEPRGGKTLTSQFEFTNVNLVHASDAVDVPYHSEVDEALLPNSNGWRPAQYLTMSSNGTATFTYP
ncbi:hypothetical protein [Vibrio mediterranei]|uniref:hypothetical protein n=1 Tax=Vibrio mediterranei TaxID=689 RepID=UPI00148DC272|nr:hypothetical protein [Vibrio mediterranei]NOI26804.1 hypothetical protein [Vibrio mediterranei]